MATWTLKKTRKGTFQLSYEDAKTGLFHDCGETSGETPLRTIQEWIMNHCNPFDQVRLWDGAVIPILPHSGECA
jgi:hypothetical protein